MRVPRGAIIAGLTAFLVLGSTGIAAAVWTASASPLTSSVTAGTLSVTMNPSDVANLTATYTPAVLSDTSAVPLTNSGSVPANYSLQLKAASNGLADVTTVTAWIVSTVSQCTPGSSVGAPTFSGILSTGVTISGSVAVAVADIICIRTAIPATYATAPGPNSTPTALLSYWQGSWSGSASASAIQSFKDTLRPTKPGTPVATTITAAKTTLTWAASTDNVAVAHYDIYRNGGLVGTVASPNVTFSDTGLTGDSSYAYRVRARDATGNRSVYSGTTNVRTTPFDTSTNYQITFGSAKLCVDGGVSPGSWDNALVTLSCQTGRSQTWQFVQTSTGVDKIVSSADSTLVWDISGSSTTDGSPVITWGETSNDNQRWALGSEGNGTVHFTNQNSGKCLTVNSSASNSPVQQFTCDGSATQSFTLTQVP